MSRRPVALLLACAFLIALAAPVVAQDDASYISVQSAHFEWTGKQDQTANFRWSATIQNPTKRRNVELSVTLILVDEAGNVIGTDSATVTVDKQSEGKVEQEGSLPYAEAAQVAQYRVSVEAAAAQ